MFDYIEKARGCIETRYFISSLGVDAKEIAKPIRSHWMVESYQWHLNVTYKEHYDHILNKRCIQFKYYT